ncbi:hypothetical protein [Dysgonomonas sp. ZJ279]|uniref:hypothetical protein n=1 Tax=Dysgonomonas sp. ZJ279 TaxID=2709796 RepID=UPI0013E9C4DE|nr:hypothetical protein [Dysgonomonas sp. ZJ279]
MFNKIFVLLFSIPLVSCVKEALPECPYQYNIQVFVSDKNYSNISDFPDEKISEDLPFNKYIQNIYYTLTDIKTGKNMIDPQRIDVAGDSKTQSIIIDLVPDGKYILAVWGNVDSSDKSNMLPENLHDKSAESKNVYLAYDTLDIVTGIAKEMSMGLKRTTGMLMVKFNDLPTTIAKIDESITSIQKDVDWHFDYSNTTDVEKSFLSTSQSLSKITTYLAPTVTGEKSKLSLMLTKTDNTVIAIPIAEVIIKRNEILGLEVTYNDTNDTWEVWANINNEWVLINNLEIN